jgi:hypothetical protein
MEPIKHLVMGVIKSYFRKKSLDFIQTVGYNAASPKLRGYIYFLDSQQFKT